MHPTGIASAMSQLPNEAIALAAASHIERELQITPWNLSSNFVACTNQVTLCKIDVYTKGFCTSFSAAWDLGALISVNVLISAFSLYFWDLGALYSLFCLFFIFNFTHHLLVTLFRFEKILSVWKFLVLAIHLVGVLVLVMFVLLQRHQCRVQ